MLNDNYLINTYSSSFEIMIFIGRVTLFGNLVTWVVDSNKPEYRATIIQECQKVTKSNFQYNNGHLTKKYFQKVGATCYMFFLIIIKQ